MGRQVSGFCFDFDGVLVDTPSFGFKIICEVFDFYELKPPTLVEFYRDLPKALQPYFKEYPPVKTPLEWFDEYAPNCKPNFFAEVPQVLSTLRDRGIPMWLISANSAQWVNTLCASVNVHHYFGEVCTGIDNKSEHLSLFCKHHGFDPTEVAYVGDFPSDMQHARDAGVCAIGKSISSEEIDDLLFEHGAHHCIDSLHDLLSFVPSPAEEEIIAATTYEINMWNYSKRGRGNKGKKFTVTVQSHGSDELRVHKGKAPSYRDAIKMLREYVPGHLIARNPPDKNGITTLSA